MLNKVQLFDRDHHRLALATIERRGDHYVGTVDIAAMPPSIRETFETYETLVNEQVLSAVDDVETLIASMGVVAVGDDGIETPLEDVQLFPKAGTISFRIASHLAHPVLK